MPQIGPNLWKVASTFFWYRVFGDGRAEAEFCPETGAPNLWGSKTPDGLKKVGWLPMTPDLAGKIRAFGEFGAPTRATAVTVELKDGEEIICFKDCTVLQGYLAKCRACGAVFHSLGRPDACPACNARPYWRCPTCNELRDQPTCPKCKTEGQMVDPFDSRPDRWEDVVYNLGIKGAFLLRFNEKGLIAASASDD